MSTQRLGVLGGGPIAAGVAALGLRANIEVMLWSRREATRERARQDIERVIWSRLRPGGALTVSPCDLLARLRIVPTLTEATDGADWVFESVVEDLNTKHAVLREAEEVMPPGAMLASTASWIPISIIAQPLKRPERFLGVHHFNPPWGRKGVEIIPGKRTAPQTVADGEELIRVFRQVPAVLTRDHPGFVGNRLVFRVFEEAIRAIVGGAAPRSIDSAYRYQLGFSVGPCESMDYIGLEFLYHILRVASKWGWDSPYEAMAFLQVQNEEGNVGPSVGRGIYSYPQGSWKRQELNTTMTDELQALALISPAVLEATRLVQKEVATAKVVDTIARDGLGWATGPVTIGRRVGPVAVAEALDRLHRHEPAQRYRADESLVAVLS